MDRGLRKENYVFSDNILKDFESLAFEHSALQGSSEDYLAEYGACWIVLGYHVQINRLPYAGERGVFSTRSGKTRPRLGFFPRYFTMEDSSGNVLVRCAGLFSVLDIETRAFAKAETFVRPFENQTGEDDLSCQPHFPDIEPEFQKDFVVRENRIDKNNHMNNKEYVAVGLETMGLSWGDLASLYIRYENEVRLGETLHLAWGRREKERLLTGATDHKIFRMAVATR